MASVVNCTRSVVRVSREQILAAFEGPIEPVRVSFRYLLGLVVVSAAMVLLSAAYAGLIAIVGYGLFYHVTENAKLLAGHDQVRMHSVVIVAPLLVGLVLILFLVKPLFSRFEKDTRRISLTPKGEPLLYEFVRRLCGTIGSPEPRRIDLIMSPNAAARAR